MISTNQNIKSQLIDNLHVGSEASNFLDLQEENDNEEVTGDGDDSCKRHNRQGCVYPRPRMRGIQPPQVVVCHYNSVIYWDGSALVLVKGSFIYNIITEGEEGFSNDHASVMFTRYTCVNMKQV